MDRGSGLGALCDPEFVSLGRPESLQRLGQTQAGKPNSSLTSAGCASGLLRLEGQPYL